MSDLFLKIINMSISASWLVLAVLLLRIVLKKAPKWVNVLLWGIVAVRLVFPFSIESALSLIPSAETISPGIMMDTVPSVQTGVPAINSVINPVIGSSLAPAPGASANPLQIWIPILSIAWVVGVVALLLYTAVSYWRLRQKVSEAVILRDNIFQSENVVSPFVLGIIKPKVYLPYHMDGQDLSHVVAHEQAHIRRRDHWWKPLGFLLLTIHWFNPLMWLAYVLLCRDIELACDEKVIKELGNEQRADYTQALVACSVNRRMIAACPLAFGEVGVKERVKSVMNYKKPAFWIIVLAVIACVVVAVCFLTNPVGFQFDEEAHTIVSANHFDMRNTDDAVAVEMNSAQISELSSRLAGVKNTRKSDEYGGFTPGYQISALLGDGTYIRISGYSLSDNDMVDIEWNGDRYVVSDSDFQEYLSRICAGEDVTAAFAGFTVNQPYGVVEVTYESPLTGFSMVAQVNTPNYMVDENGHLFSALEHSDASNWTDLGNLTEFALSKDNFDDLFRNNSGDGWFTRQSASAIRKNTTKAWTVIYNQDVLYYVLQQSNGELYLAYGYYDYSEKDDPGSDDTYIRWLYKLAPQSESTVSSATKWFDYLETPDEMVWDGRLEINLPEFPDVTFRWYPEKMEAVTEDEIIPLYTGMPIWNTYFCDLTGDGFPELCSTYTYGSGMIDSRIIIYDYANGASYEMSDRGYHNFNLWMNESDGLLYVDKRVYPNDELVSSGRLVFKDDCFQIAANLPSERVATTDQGEQWNDGIVFDSLAPNEEMVSTFEIVLDEEGSAVECSIGYSRTGLTLIYGLVCDDGTEYAMSAVGGHGRESFENLPAGVYHLFVRNSDYSGVPAYEDPEAFPDVSFIATGVMNWRVQ